MKPLEGGPWHLVYYEVRWDDGKVRSRSFSDLEEAKEFARQPEQKYAGVFRVEVLSEPEWKS